MPTGFNCFNSVPSSIPQKAKRSSLGSFKLSPVALAQVFVPFRKASGVLVARRSN
jgi:hypothetical protein